MLPSLEHFTLESNTRLDIKEPENPDETVFKEECGIPSRVVGDVLPALKKITLDMLDPSVAAKWLGDYLEKMKERKEWNESHELIVVRELGDEGLGEFSYCGEVALAWCRDRL